MENIYDVLSLPVTLFSQIEKNTDEIKPFVAVYFPAELLTQMNWTRKTSLNLLVDGETLIISKKELEYEIYPEPEPNYI